ncbi:fungal-specific transcription factor domain-containing protein [Mycena polygramma]|nr:fungal-specific transcription factor domain-containing protein [Mycena polygramma]
MPGNRCTNCITSHSECIHTPRELPAEAPNATESPPATQSLESAQQLVEAILSTSTVYVPSNDPNTSYQILLAVAKYARSLEEKVAGLLPDPLTASSIRPTLTEESLSPHEEAVEVEDALPIKDPARFYGQSSSIQFIKSAMKHFDDGNISYVVGVQRPEFWTVPPWEQLTIEARHHEFPDKDLLESLVKIYFEQINPISSVLHGPSFLESISSDLHLRDAQFGAVVLAVCALASRYSDDPRVFLDGSDSEHSCGWRWFEQVRPLRAALSPEPSLYQLQLICLSVLFLSGTSAPEEGWILAGLGLRFAQGAGAHHRSGYRNMAPLTAELYKRVFWVLVVMDTITSSFNGRPSITQPDDFDVDLPLGMDPEHWGVPNAIQPCGKLSAGAFVPVYLGLVPIFARIHKAVYPVNGQVCSEDVVVQLDSALNEWVDGIPAHLRWDPNQPNQIFLDQSAVLYSTYYHAQILLHRPFIPGPGKQSISTGHFPSLAICANAARSCGHVLDVQARRGRGLLHCPSLMTALFDCAVVLLINVWAIVGGRKSRTPEDFTRATADAQNCVRVLRLYERRWRVAGRKCDIISAMLNLGKHTAAAQSLKRSRDAEEDMISNTPEPSLDPGSDAPTTDSSVSATEQLQALERSIQETNHLFSLPLHTDELGRLPVYDSFHYEFTFAANDIHYPYTEDPQLLHDPAFGNTRSPGYDSRLCADLRFRFNFLFTSD